MKQKLLLLFMGCLISLSARSQFANTPPNIHQCGWEVFDLTVQNPVILGNQDPNLYAVTYHTTFAAANAGSPEIQNPSSFAGNASQTIFARVTNQQTGTFATTSFNISWNFDGSLAVYAPDDVTVCNNYVLPAPSVGQYYASPNGGGLPIPAGTVITATQTLYLYASQGNCTAQQAFTVTIISLPEVSAPDVYTCESFTLPVLPAGAHYFTGPGGTGTSIAPGTEITQSMVVYIYAENTSCSTESQFSITIGEIQANSLNPIHACGEAGVGTFDLSIVAALASSAPDAIVTVHQTMADAASASAAIDVSSPFVSASATLYVRVQIAGCSAITPLQLIYDYCTNNAIYGFVTVDNNANGCTTADPNLSGITVLHTFNGIQTLYYTNQFGYYEILNVQAGENTVALDTTTLPAGVSGSASPVTVAIASDQIENVSFCLTSDGSAEDLAVSVSPFSQVIPGFQAIYRVRVMNNSPVVKSGSVTIDYDAAKLSFSAMSPDPDSGTFNSVTYNFTGLPAFTSVQFYVYFNVLPPPAANSGDVVTLSATVTSPNDSDASNDSASITQTIVNSQDPNDITVHEGPIITMAQAQDYLHYTIRFQNMGTAEAQTVRIENELSDLLDWSTFRPVYGSHGYNASRSGNHVTFDLSNIFLVPESWSESDSQGYVTYEIKPVAGIEIGDVIENSAAIYFDFNPAVVTNTATTTVQMLSVPEPGRTAFVLYPNPASATFSIKAADTAQAAIEITDSRGSQVFSRKLSFVNDEATVDISGIASGLYFVKITSEKAASVKKLMIR